jgi:epoxyqueuosine reductase
MHYLHERFETRTDPAKLLPGAQSVICVAMNYHVPLGEPMGVAHPAKVARYALGVDYHVHIKDRLYALADHVRRLAPEAQTKCGIDTAAILERELAARAGVGWIGKNTVVINERIGSWLFLGEVLTTLSLPLDEPAKDRCGTCRRCIDACPTQAIVEPRMLDATRCISYLTIEHRGPIDEELAGKMNGWIVGCDICQDVCPWNGRAPVATLEELQPRHPAGVIDAAPIGSWSQEEYWAATRRSATRRVKLEQFKRNAAIALRKTPSSSETASA